MNATPHSWESERVLLGGLLSCPELHPDVREVMRPEAFTRPNHEALYRLFLHLLGQGIQPDLPAVLDAMRPAPDVPDKIRLPDVEAFGGTAYLCALPSACAHPDLVVPTARRLQDMANRRELQRVLAETLESLSDPTCPTDHAADVLERRVTGIRASTAPAQDWTRLGVLTEQVIGDLRRGDSGWCISTGFEEIDRAIQGGMRAGEFVVLAARPKAGKSMMALQMGVWAARMGHGVGLVSVEMSMAQNARRILAAEAKVSVGRIRSHRLDEDQIRRVVQASEDIQALPLYVDDRANVSVSQIRSRVRRLRAICPSLRLLVVDYLQLLATDGHAENRTVAVGAMSRALKLLAKEEGLAILCLAQLNRGVEDRKGQVPIASDLRESGSIEQDLDTLLMLWRPELADPDDPSLKGIALLKVELAREGEAGVVARLAFDGPTQRFLQIVSPPPERERYY